MKTISYCQLSYVMLEKIPQNYGEKLRGFFASIRRENDLYHNHTSEGKDIYRYPLIQYKVINGCPAIIALNEAIDYVKNEFIQHDKIILNGKEFTILESKLDIRQEDFDVTDELFEYRFESVWLALNEKNHLAYQRGELNLNRALSNNLLSDLKGLNIRAEKRILVKGHFKPQELLLDNHMMIGFKGGFTCNVKIPDYLGTGKRKSIGFGMIKKV